MCQTYASESVLFVSNPITASPVWTFVCHYWKRRDHMKDRCWDTNPSSKPLQYNRAHYSRKSKAFVAESYKHKPGDVQEFVCFPCAAYYWVGCHQWNMVCWLKSIVPHDTGLILYFKTWSHWPILCSHGWQIIIRSEKVQKCRHFYKSWKHCQKMHLTYCFRGSISARFSSLYCYAWKKEFTTTMTSDLAMFRWSQISLPLGRDKGCFTCLIRKIWT